MSNEGLRTVVITGAGSGIGKALVRSCTDAGMNVVPIYREAPIGIHESAVIDHADFSAPQEVDTLAERLQNRYSNIDWIIHCAGHLESGSELTMLESAMHRSFSVNALAPIRLSLALRGAITRGGGIVFISSTAGLWGSSTAPLYAASKSALHGFAFSLQKIFGRDRYSIVVAPGPTNTSMRQEFAGDAASQQSPEVVADAILQILDSVLEDTREQRLFAVRDGKTEMIRCEPDV